MIAGTFVLEGLTMQFRLPDTKDGSVTVYVQDGLTGESAKILCSPREFAASMALALDFDGMTGALESTLHEYAKGIQWPNRDLRWIP